MHDLSRQPSAEPLPPGAADPQRLRLLVESTTDYAIITLDATGRVTGWNPGARQLYGYAADEIRGRTLDDCFTPEDRRLGKPAAELAVAEQDGRTEDDAWRVRRDGTRFWANVLTCALRGPDGALCGFAVIARDVTARKKAEWLDRDRRQVLELMAGNRPLDVVLLRLAELLERQTPGIRASVLLLRDGRLSHAAAPTLPAAFTRAVGKHLLRLAADLRATAGGACGEGIAVSDVARDAAWDQLRDEALPHGLRCCWSANICSAVSGEVLGTFLLYGAEVRPPTDEERELIEMLCQFTAISVEQRLAAEQLTHQAQHDVLTGLPNRTLFEDRLQQAIGQAHRTGQSVALFLIDLDRFKYVNDTLGHQAGDMLLQQVASRWLGILRESDTLARLGGDEFALILPALADERVAARVAERLFEALRAPCQLLEHELYVTASVGITLFPRDGQDSVALQRCADTAMYRVKSLGRNGSQWFAPEMNAVATERLELDGHLRRALGNGDFELHYQPQVDRQGRLCGVEALLRWHHPKLGYVPPAKFIPLAEENGLIVPIGTWVLNEACRQNQRWQAAGLRPIKVAVNLSALQFAQADFEQVVAAALRDSGLAARWLELEITESLLMQNTQDAIRKLACARDLGTGVAVDDFGTGYSSLAYLQRLPIDTLKIDRSFVKEVGPAALAGPSASDTAVIRAIVSLGHTLGLGVVAEGVETEAQREFLVRIGADGMQGYLFAKPLTAAELQELLAADAGGTGLMRLANCA